MRLLVKTEINPSEDPEKVVESVENIFPQVDLEISKDRVKGESEDLESLDNLKNLLGLQAIRNSARRELKKGKSSESIRFSLNKQAATVKKVSFSKGDTPLGAIDVKIEYDRPDDLIDYLAPYQGVS